MQSIWNQFGTHGVQVVGVAVRDSEANSKAWLTGLGATFPSVADDAAFSIMYSYTDGGDGVPHNYVIGRDMIIRKDNLGELTEAFLQGLVMDVVYMRAPVDLEMIMDVSDTMNSAAPAAPSGDPKLVLMRRAATMITDFLHDHGQVDDRMGLVWFTDDASEYVNASGQKLLPIPTNTVDLKAQITSRPTGTCTAMGAGMQKAFDGLSGSAHARYAILCTDGMQNIDPKAAPVSGHYEIVDIGGWLCGGHSSVPSHPGIDIATYQTRVHTIGIGITATYAPLLQDIANATGGFYRATDDPATDLDLIYFVDLCNSMAGGSPVVIHHHAGRLEARACTAEERFYVNRSVRKISVMLSWEEAQRCNLTFWLRAPDSTLLDLHTEMKYFETYCLATVYLPKEQEGKTLPHVGQWQMIIRGETEGSSADYHALVIAEDHESKFHVDFPRETHKVGSLLPIHIKLALNEKSFTRASDVMLEVSRLRESLEKLVAGYKLPPLKRGLKMRPGATVPDPIVRKLRAMERDRAFRARLKPVRTEYSMKKGNLECKATRQEIIASFPLKQTGLYSFKIVAQYDLGKEGLIRRTSFLSVHVA